MRKEVRYQVGPIDGPGSRGELRIEGTDADVVRRYSAPPRPQVDPRMLNGVDGFGMPAIRARTGAIVEGGVAGRIATDANGASTLHFANGTSAGIANGMVSNPDGRARLAGMLEGAGVAPDVSRTVAELATGPSSLTIDGRLTDGSQVNALHAEEIVVPVGRMSREAEAAAHVARWQMARDVA
jgi:hypothetical protein